MHINYNQILKKNMINVFKEVLQKIEKEGLQEGHHLYITFKTDNKNNVLPISLKEKFPDNMTIIIQHEYWNFKVSNNYFNITLSFNNIKSYLKIYFKSIISFADPYANFGLKFINDKNIKKNKKPSKRKQKNNKEKFPQNNIIEFKKFKKT